MKKVLLSALLAVLSVGSCSNESSAIHTVQSMKTPQMENFDKAFK